jgi:hypothetical protein
LINAGPNDAVSLRGLTIDGTGAAATGIKFNTGKSLTVENCIIRHVTSAGIDFLPNATSNLSVSNSLVADNGTHGIYVSPTGSGTFTAVFNRVEANTNAISGIVVDGTTSTGTINATAAESVAADNIQGAGFAASSSAGHALTTLTVFHSVSANNVYGITANGTGATLRAAQSTSTGNTYGYYGVLTSYGDNYIDGNGGDQGQIVPVNMR